MKFYIGYCYRKGSIYGRYYYWNQSVRNKFRDFLNSHRELVLANQKTDSKSYPTIGKIIRPFFREDGLSILVEIYDDVDITGFACGFFSSDHRYYRYPVISEIRYIGCRVDNMHMDGFDAVKC